VTVESIVSSHWYCVDVRLHCSYNVVRRSGSRYFAVILYCSWDTLNLRTFTFGLQACIILQRSSDFSTSAPTRSSTPQSSIQSNASWLVWFPAGDHNNQFRGKLDCIRSYMKQHQQQQYSISVQTSCVCARRISITCAVSPRCLGS